MIKQPQAGIKIYNYEDRLGSSFYNGKKETQNIEKIIKIKSEIISISTLKHKAQPAGEFQITLAPTKNWIATISPGSWLSIHMTSDKTTDDILFSFNEKSLKMIGRIDTIRMSMRVDQTTGARQTVYTISGKDWGQIFESILYIDPMVYETLSNNQTAIFSSVDTLLGSVLETSKNGASSTTNLIRAMLQVWGSVPLIPQGQTGGLSSGSFINTQVPFEIPKELSQDLNLKTSSLSKSINLKTGRLIANNIYDESRPEAYGGIIPQSLFGSNAIWQVMSAHSCEQVNEMLCDIIWESDIPKLTLFKRIKPFALNCVSYKDNRIESKFVNLFKTEIKKESIISIDCGDNWRDKINAVEILPAFPPGSPVTQGLQVIAKPRAQKADHTAIKREGIRPLLMQSYFFPYAGKSEDVVNWIPAFIDWYFNTHKMLNGNISFLGCSNYIPVGSNIVLDSSVFAKAKYVSNQTEQNKLLAHVESVSHNFSVEINGARSFVTGINFVRGVFVDSQIKDLINKESFAIDSSATSMSDSDEIVKGIYEI